MDYLCRLTFQKLISKNLVGGASDKNSLLHPTASAALKVVSRSLERLRSRALSGQTVTNSEQWIYQSSGATSPPLLQPSVCLFSTSDWVFSPLFIRIVRCNPPPAVQSLAQVFFECLFLRLDGVKPKSRRGADLPLVSCHIIDLVYQPIQCSVDLRCPGVNIFPIVESPFQ